MVVPIVAMAIFMGVLPNLFLRPMEPSVNRVIERITGQPAGAGARRRQPFATDGRDRTPSAASSARRRAAEPPERRVE